MGDGDGSGGTLIAGAIAAAVVALASVLYYRSRYRSRRSDVGGSLHQKLLSPAEDEDEGKGTQELTGLSRLSAVVVTPVMSDGEEHEHEQKETTDAERLSASGGSASAEAVAGRAGTAAGGSGMVGGEPQFDPMTGTPLNAAAEQHVAQEWRNAAASEATAVAAATAPGAASAGAATAPAAAATAAATTTTATDAAETMAPRVVQLAFATLECSQPGGTFAAGAVVGTGASCKVYSGMCFGFPVAIKVRGAHAVAVANVRMSVRYQRALLYQRVMQYSLLYRY
jgi:hypothetical protein